MALSEQMSGLRMYDDNFVMVASIDFGTTFSGYAFSFKSNKNEVRMNKNWGEEAGHQSFKTPTSVLLDARGNMLAFGFAAETKYNEMVLTNGEESCELYRHFKMALHNQKHLTRTTKVQSVRGTSENAIVIFTHAVKFLKDHLHEAVAKSVSQKPNPDMIRWVITVPAIWSEESKRFMREVAHEAGITKDMDSRQFMICLEPEAASIYCRQLETDHFSSGSADDTKLLKKPGEKYMIVDAGGGTIDITAHEIQRDGTVKELLAASGGAWGGTKVDENFVNILIQILGKQFIARYQRECPSEWLDLRVNFERRKKAVKPDDDEATISIPLSWGITAKYQEVMGKNIQQVIQSTQVQGVKFNNGNVIFDASVVRGIFNPVTSQIVSHIQRQLRSPKASGVRLILLVGGFGECAFVQDAITRAVSPRVKVLCPSEAGISIIKGAVLFGHSPSVVRSRISRKTYGTQAYSVFDPSKHPNHRREIKEAGPHCLIFKTFVKKGESVNINDEKKFPFVPMSSDQTVMRFKLYSADTESVEYPDDPLVKQMGEIEISTPDTTKGLNRKAEVKVYFGATEIYVEAYEKLEYGEGDRAETTLDFLAD